MTDSGPHELHRTGLVIAPGESVHAREMGEGFYEKLDTDFNGFRGHTLVQRFSFDKDWGMWEMHPNGDEIVYLLSGSADFVLLEANGSERIVRLDKPNSAVVVPRNIWHTARPHEPTSMLFITPGEGTQHAEHPPGADA